MAPTHRTFSATLRADRRGFTLVELLVVVAVIGILIGVLLPALSGARESSFRIRSANNIRQLLLIHTVYANDNENQFPVVMNRWSGDYRTSKNVPREEVFNGYQLFYGGYAGFFSLAQENVPEGLSTIVQWDREYRYAWNPGQGTWNYRVEDTREGILMNYFESTGELQMLQNPADQSDGEPEFTSGMPPVVPTTINGIEDVYWGNISYMYIVGLNTETRPLGIIGDETNHPDAGRAENPASGSGYRVANTDGTMRRLRELNQRGYQREDNHGDAGGNWGYTDGSVVWEEQRVTGDTSNPKQDPHDKIFGQIDQVMARDGKPGSTFTETVD
jgi:prepilin-type N-terminal cleavage/methylation domain-containing protein